MNLYIIINPSTEPDSETLIFYHKQFELIAAPDKGYALDYAAKHFWGQSKSLSSTEVYDDLVDRLKVYEIGTASDLIPPDDILLEGWHNDVSVQKEAFDDIKEMLKHLFREENKKPFCMPGQIDFDAYLSSGADTHA